MSDKQQNKYAEAIQHASTSVCSEEWKNKLWILNLLCNINRSPWGGMLESYVSFIVYVLVTYAFCKMVFVVTKHVVLPGAVSIPPFQANVHNHNKKH